MERDVYLSSFVFIYFVGRSYVLTDCQGKKMNAGCQLESGRLCWDTALSVRHIALFLTCCPGIISQVSLRRVSWAFVWIM